MNGPGEALYGSETTILTKQSPKVEALVTDLPNQSAELVETNQACEPKRSRPDIAG